MNLYWVNTLSRTPKRLLASLSIVAVGFIGCTPARETAKAQDYPVSISVQQTVPSFNSDVEALVKMGPRVTGMPVMEQASNYLVAEFRKAGYEAEIQTFTYDKFEDQGSSLTVNGVAFRGLALRGTTAGSLTGHLVSVPNVGRIADFATVNVKGAIAITQRGEIPFTEKVQNAAAAGAIGLVIVNNAADNFSGILTQSSPFPVLAISGNQGKPLLEQARRELLTVTLSINAGQRKVTGRNVIAHLAGVTQPKVLLGGHYDSVAGSPGANDNASGTAVVLAIARNIAQTPQAQKVWFVAFDGEEDGLHGSKAFVKTSSPQLLKGLKGMLNFDMVGVNQPLRVSGTPFLTQLAQAIKTDTVTLGSSSGGSDHASFAAVGVPVLFFHRGLEPNYHKPTDQVVDPTLLNETTRTALKILRQLLAKEEQT